MTAPVTLPSRAAQARESAGDKFMRIVGTHLTREIAAAARIHGRQDFPGDSWEEFIAWLRGGITVAASCVFNGENGSVGRRQDHTLQISADGAITLLDHQVRDLADEQFMHSLGGSIPSCVEFAIGIRLGGERDLWRNGGGQSNAGRLRTLHTMVAWAQRLDATAVADWQRLIPVLTRGVTPAVLDAWLADGWTFEAALPFWEAEAEMDAANEWRTAGQVTRRAAALASDGIGPNDDERWAAAGFTTTRAQRWRVAHLRLDPVICKRLDDAGWTPSDYQNARQADLDPVTVAEWAEAGVAAAEPSGGQKGHLLRAWWNHTRGDLAQTLTWYATGINPSIIVALNAQPGLPPLTPALVQDWRNAGMPVDFHMYQNLRSALQSGLSARRYRAVIAAHPQGNNLMWSFPQRLRAVQRFFDAGPA